MLSIGFLRDNDKILLVNVEENQIFFFVIFVFCYVGNFYDLTSEEGEFVLLKKIKDVRY